VRACRTGAGFLHPAGVDDVSRLLTALGPAVTYGLRRVELRRQVRPLLVAHLWVPGLVVLYEQPEPPWTLPGAPHPDTLHRLRRAGAKVHSDAWRSRVDWPPGTLRDFMLFDGLAHEIGHHLVQQRTGRATPAMRTTDHERRADAFAAACRASVTW